MSQLKRPSSPVPDPNLVNMLTEADENEKEMKLETVKSILCKPQEKRDNRDLRTLALQIREIKFFKDRMKEGSKSQLKDKDIEMICSGLEY